MLGGASFSYMFSIVGNKSAMSSRNKSTILASNMGFLERVVL